MTITSQRVVCNIWKLGTQFHATIFDVHIQSLTRRETLSTEYLEQERKIAKEKLKLEAIRKEVIYIDGFEDVSVGYTNFTVLIGWIKYDLMHVW